MKKQSPLYTAKSAATQLGCTDARVRQILIAAGGAIGRKAESGTAWILTDADLGRVKKFLKNNKNMVE
jgi:hypothetical protein